MKLVPKHGFGKSVNKRVELPYPADTVRAHITIVLHPDGRINVCGAIKNRELSVEMLRVGMERLKDYHRQQAAVRVSGSGLVGLDGQPIAAERRDS